MNYKLSILGCGNMCGSILAGTLNKKIITPNQVVLKNSSIERSTEVALKFGVNATNEITNIESADFLMLGVKPQILKDITLQVSEKTIIISVLAGVTTNTLCQKFNTDKVVRVMPNIAAAVNEGLSGVVFTKELQPKERKHVLAILNASGKTIVLTSEQSMNRFTLLSGSLIGIIGFWEDTFNEFEDNHSKEILTNILHELGNEKFFTKIEAAQIIDQTFIGYEKTKNEMKISAKEIQVKVSSKNGVTESMTDFLSTNDAKKIQRDFFIEPEQKKHLMKKLLQQTFVIGEKRAEELG